MRPRVGAKRPTRGKVDHTGYVENQRARVERGDHQLAAGGQGGATQPRASSRGPKHDDIHVAAQHKAAQRSRRQVLEVRQAARGERRSPSVGRP